MPDKTEELITDRLGVGDHGVEAIVRLAKEIADLNEQLRIMTNRCRILEGQSDLCDECGEEIS